MNSRKIYRLTNLGTALTRSLDEFVQEEKITAEQKESILKEYDKVRIIATNHG